MNHKVILILCFIILNSCEEKENTDFENLGSVPYKGMFYGSTPTTRHSPVEVTLYFSSNRFIGESENQYSPLICQGTYSFSGQEIQFKNECTNLATFKLDGTYSYNSSVDSLRLQRSENGITELYVLKKELTP